LTDVGDRVPGVAAEEHRAAGVALAACTDQAALSSPAARPVVFS
jgi:hypothetical protein